MDAPRAGRPFIPGYGVCGPQDTTDPVVVEGVAEVVAELALRRPRELDRLDRGRLKSGAPAA